MKKKQKPIISLEKYFQTIIHFIVSSEEGIMTRKEIEDTMAKYNICQSRQVSKILDAMISNGHLVREKISGQKRLGYVINEEIISNMNESYIISGVKKNGMPVYDKLTQTELNQEIKEMVKRYKKLYGDKKSDLNNDDMLFYACNITLITLSLSWIPRLILSIQGGVFHDKINKINLARKNMEMLEEFVRILCLHLQEKFPNGYDMALTGMHNFFECLDPFENTPYSRKIKEPSSLMH